MNFSNIFNTNKRQFTSVLKREGITVTNYYDSNKTYRVFFRRNGKGTNPQGKLRFYYAQDTDITIGTIFTLKGENYLVISQDGIESDVYFTSMAVRCDTSLSVCISENNYMNIPCAVISDKYAVSQGNVISIATGNVTVYTGINQYSLKILDTYAYYNFGGYYKFGTSFQNNGLLYVYLTKEAMPNTDTYSLTYNGVSSLDLSDGTYQLSYTAVKNGTVVNNPSLSYTVSDSSIATVSDTGLLTMIAAGNVTVTATWSDTKNTTCVTTITIADSSDPDVPTPPVPTGTAIITGTYYTLRAMYKRTYTVTFKDNNGNDVDWSTVNFQWNVVADFNAIQTTVDNKITVSVKNEDLIGQSFVLSVIDLDGNFTSASVTIDIVE